MSKLNALLLILGVALAACAGTSKPAASPTTSLEPIVTALADATLAQPTPTTSSPTSKVSLSEPTPFAAAVPLRTAAPMPTVATQSPWPHFLRQLDFGVPAGNSYNPRAIAIHPGLERLYARTHIPSPDYQGIGAVAVLDLHTGGVLAVVETGQDNYSEGQLAVDAVHNRVYVVNPDETSCSVLDASSLQVVDTLQGVDLFSLDAENGRLYVAGLAGLRVLNLADYTILREVSLPDAPQFLALAVDVANDRAYVLYRDNSGYVLGFYDATTLQARTTISLPGPPDDLLPDPTRGRLYLTLNDGEHALFWTLDGDGHLLEEQQLGDWTRHTPLALDPVGDRLFLGRDVYNDYGITVRDLKTGQDTADRPLDASPNALAWDAGSSRLFVSQTYKNQVAVVDVGASQACAEQGECTSAIFPTAINLVDLAVDPLHSHFYVTDTAGRLHVLDSDTGGKLALLPGAGRIAVDSAHSRLYTGGEGADHVRIFDADSLQQTGEIRSRAIPVADAHSGGLYLVQSGIYIASPETMTITSVISDTLPESSGFSPNPAAVDAVVDPGSGRIFAIINNGVPGSNNGNYLYVYDPVTYTRIFTDTERSVNYVDVDPNTGRAYISRIHLAGRSTSLFDPGQRAYTARLDAVFGALRVDPALGRVYLSDYGQKQGYLLILDAANLDVVGSVPIPGGFYLRALDPWRDLLYLAADDGQVQIWSATGGQLPAPFEPMPAELPVQEARQLFLSPDGRTLFAGSLYRSEDGGQSWFRISEGLPDRGVQAVAISPGFAQDHTLFVALMATDEGLGIWKSTDGGRSWPSRPLFLTTIPSLPPPASRASSAPPTAARVGCASPKAITRMAAMPSHRAWSPSRRPTPGTRPFSSPIMGYSAPPTEVKPGARCFHRIRNRWPCRPISPPTARSSAGSGMAACCVPRTAARPGRQPVWA
jgi:DNA-binding beta-propeller fold protein YncE